MASSKSQTKTLDARRRGERLLKLLEDAGYVFRRTDGLPMREYDARAVRALLAAALEKE